MNGHRRVEDQDDSAHGASSMSEPLLSRKAGNPREGDPAPKHYLLRQWARMTEYFANHPPTVGYMLFLSFVFGISSGIVAFVYDTYFEAILTLVWEVSTGAPLKCVADVIISGRAFAFQVTV